MKVHNELLLAHRFSSPEASGVVQIEKGSYGVYIGVKHLPGPMGLIDLFYRGQGGPRPHRPKGCTQLVVYDPSDEYRDPLLDVVYNPDGTIRLELDKTQWEIERDEQLYLTMIARPAEED